MTNLTKSMMHDKSFFAQEHVSSIHNKFEANQTNRMNDRHLEREFISWVKTSKWRHLKNIQSMWPKPNQSVARQNFIKLRPAVPDLLKFLVKIQNYRIQLS